MVTLSLIVILPKSAGPEHETPVLACGQRCHKMPVAALLAFEGEGVWAEVGSMSRTLPDLKEKQDKVGERNSICKGTGT